MGFVLNETKIAIESPNPVNGSQSVNDTAQSQQLTSPPRSPLEANKVSQFQQLMGFQKAFLLPLNPSNHMGG
jgi:hypothetical protein